MAQKKKRKWDSISRKRADEVEQEEVRRAEVACCLLRSVGKKPYYLLRGTDCIALNNLAELHDRIDLFMEDEAEWVASWIEYLGDTETADKIRAAPAEFKIIICARYQELRRL